MTPALPSNAAIRGPALLTRRAISPTREVVDYVPCAKPVRRVNDVPVLPIKREGEE